MICDFALRWLMNDLRANLLSQEGATFRVVLVASPAPDVVQTVVLTSFPFIQPQDVPWCRIINGNSWVGSFKQQGTNRWYVQASPVIFECNGDTFIDENGIESPILPNGTFTHYLITYQHPASPDAQEIIAYGQLDETFTIPPPGSAPAFYVFTPKIGDKPAEVG